MLIPSQLSVTALAVEPEAERPSLSHVDGSGRSLARQGPNETDDRLGACRLSVAGARLRVGSFHAASVGDVIARLSNGRRAVAAGWAETEALSMGAEPVRQPGASPGHGGQGFSVANV